jgi:hypothetical protein
MSLKNLEKKLKIKGVNAIVIEEMDDFTYTVTDKYNEKNCAYGKTINEALQNFEKECL